MAGTYLLPTLSHTPLSATHFPMIPYSAVISSAGSGKICKGSRGAGRRTERVGGFGQKSRSGENVPSPSPSPFSSEPPHMLFSSPHTPRTLCLFSWIRRTFSPLKLLLSSLPNPSRPLDALLSAPACHRPPDNFPGLLKLQLPAVYLIRSRPMHSHAFRAYNWLPDPLHWPTHFNVLSLPDSIGIIPLFPLLPSHNIHIQS